METYADYAPTPFDVKGLGLDDKKHWLVAPFSRTRDSTNLAKSNFDVGLEAVGGTGDDVETHCFDHWGVGWIEIVLVRPESEAAAKAAAIEKRLEGYAVLDEDKTCKGEQDTYLESWESWGASEFVSGLVAKLGLDEDVEAALEGADKQVLLEFYESLNPAGDHQDDGAPVIRRSLQRATTESVDAFLEKLPAPLGP